MIKVAIVEDNQDLQEAFEFILDNSEHCECVGVYDRAETALKGLQKQPAEVVLMDIELPGMTGVECVQQLKTLQPEVDVLMITVHSDDKYVFDSLQAGACGYLTKNTSPTKLLDAILEVHKGGAPMSSNIARMVVGSFNRLQTPKPSLTRREKEVLEQLCNGKSYKMIADALCVSEDTVRFHIKKIYRKLQVNSKSEAVIKALRDHII
ncbi:MAG: response regulator transcription factor [Bacteroidota bacterium]